MLKGLLGRVSRLECKLYITPQFWILLTSTCSIDTGIDYTHPSLGGGFGPGHKVIGGFDFVGDAYNGE